MKLSFCLIVKNEEHNLPRCLMSLRDLADEIIIVDSGSTDRTRQIAGDFKARFFQEEWKGYGAQKNSALQKASHPWVFSIDADEEISGELAAHLYQWKSQPESAPDNAWLVCRCVYYNKKWIRHGDWYPDWVIRLFNRDHGRFSDDLVHEKVIVHGPLNKLRGDLYHYTYKDYADQLKRIDKYARLWARQKSQAGKVSNAYSPLMHSLFRFLRGYILRAGILDGKTGLQIALANAYEAYLKYKLLRKKRAKNEQVSNR